MLLRQLVTLFSESRLARPVDECTSVATFYSLAALMPQHLKPREQHTPAAERGSFKGTTMIFGVGGWIIVELEFSLLESGGRRKSLESGHWACCQLAV